MRALKNFIARMKLDGLIKRMDSTLRSFPNDLRTPKRILICLPSSLRELTLVKQFLPKVSDMFKNAQISLLTNPGVKVHDIYPRRGYQILTSTSDQMSWSGLPKQAYLKTLQEYKFDMVLDFNFEFSYFTAAVLLSFPKSIRIGQGNHLGQPYYNVEIKTRYLRDERNIYRSILDTLAKIIDTSDQTPAVNPGS